MCYYCEAYLSAAGGKKDVFLVKKAIRCQLNILQKLDELLGDLDHTLNKALFVFLTLFPFILILEQSQISLVVLTSSDVTPQPGILPALTIALKSVVEGAIIFLKRSLAQTAPAICHLQHNFMLSFAVYAKPKSPILFG